MKQYILFFIMSVFFMPACKKEHVEPVRHILSIDYEMFSKINLSEYISGITVIPLETTEDCLIGEVAKVQIFNNKVFVLDKITNKLSVFDISGKYLDRLSKKGQGYGEYLTMFDFSVNEKGVYIMDISSHKINHYGFDFSFMDATVYPAISTGFMTDAEEFWLYNEPTYRPDDYRLVKINKKGGITDRFFPRNSVSGKSYYVSSNVFQRNAAELFFSPRFSNLIYKFAENGWKPEIQILFKDKTFSGEGDMDISGEDIEDGRFMFRDNYYISDNYIIVSYVADNHGCFSFHNMSSGQTVSGQVENDLFPDCNSFYPRWIDGNYLIECNDANVVLDYFPGWQNAGSLTNLRPDDNPVLILYKLK